MKNAIVREPSNSFKQCISSHPSHDTVSPHRAVSQHRIYVQTLKDLGLDVIELPKLESFPDSCFVEDTAIIHNNKVLMAFMGAESRRGEEISVQETLEELFHIKRTTYPATIEGGDVIHFSDFLISGITQRTNLEGVELLRTLLQTDVKTVVDRDIIHLKSYVTYLDEKNIIMEKRYSNHPVFEGMNKIVLEDSERYASNTLTFNGTVLIPKNYPSAVEALKEQDYDVITLEMSEFEKCEGAITCLSLIF